MTICEKVFPNIEDVGRTIVFCGAGLSVPCGMDDWLGAMNKVIEECKKLRRDPVEIQFYELLYRQENYPQMMQVVYDQIGPVKYENILATIFQRDVDCSDLHKKLVKIPFAGIITTNFDKLIETAYAIEHQRTPFTQTHDPDGVRRLMSWDKFFVFKMHGDAHDLDKVIIKKTDYESMLQRKDIEDLLRNYLLSYQILFLGYSLKDPDFLNIWEMIDNSVKLRAPGLLVTQKGGHRPDEIAKLAKMNIHLFEPESIDPSYTFIAELVHCLMDKSAGITRKPAVISLDEASLLQVSLMLINIFDEQQLNNFDKFLKSLIISTILKPHRESLTLDALYAEVTQVLEVDNVLLREKVEGVLFSLQSSEIITIQEGSISVTQDSGARYRKSIDGFRGRMEGVANNLLQRVCSKLGIASEPADAGLVRDLLYALIQGHGKLLSQNILFYKRMSMEQQEFDSLIQEFLTKKNAQGKVELAKGIIREVINNATDEEEQVLFKLLQMYFLTNSFALNYSSEKLLKSYVQGFRAYFDSNILLQALAVGHSNYQISARLLDKTKSLGIRLFVLDVILNEIKGHLDLAIGKYYDLVPTGISPLDSIGAYIRLIGSRKCNVFLSAYYNLAKVGRKIEWEEFLKDLTERSGKGIVASKEKIESYLLNTFNVEKVESVFSEKELGEVKRLGADVVSLRKLGGRFTTELLCLDEAKQFLWIYKDRQSEAILKDRVWFITNDHFIMELFERNKERYTVPCSHTPLGWYQYMQLVDYDARASRNFGKLFAFAEIGALDDDLAIEAIKMMISKELDLVKKGAASVTEFATELLEKFHIKSVIDEFARAKRSGEFSREEFVEKVREKVNAAIGQYVAVKKIDLAKAEETQKRLHLTEKALAKEKYKRGQAISQLRRVQKSGRKKGKKTK